MSSGPQIFSCPRCKRGEFRSLPGPDGRAYCPWCGEAVSGGAPAPQAPVPSPAAPPPSHDAPLREQLAESERRREQAEAELRKELDKKQEIKKAVQAEMGRLEGELHVAQDRIRRKDEEHAAAIEVLGRMKEERERTWAAERKAMQESYNEKEIARRMLESLAAERLRKETEAQELLEQVQVERDKLKTALENSNTGLADLRVKFTAAEARLNTVKSAEAQNKDLTAQLQKAQTKVTLFQSEVEKRDLRIKELQGLVKTLGERLNDLADRPH